jgi:hypothetical protein
MWRLSNVKIRKCSLIFEILFVNNVHIDCLYNISTFPLYIHIYYKHNIVQDHTFSAILFPHIDLSYFQIWSNFEAMLYEIWGFHFCEDENVVFYVVTPCRLTVDRYPPASLHGVTTQKSNIVMFMADSVKWEHSWHVQLGILARMYWLLNAWLLLYDIWIQLHHFK